ncbi:MAG: Flagellar motor switch protein FliM [Pseudomonadota bacterium]|jgi:flagellar motor switch protein FliM
MATQPLLSPEELAALTESVRTAPPEGDGYNTSLSVQRHDLAAEDSSLGVNLVSIDMVNERFIRLFRLGMLEVLRVSPRINPTRAQIMRFGDYVKDLRAPLSVNILRVNPLRGYSLVVVEPAVIFSSLDSFFGGFGRGVGQLPPGRLFTPTENRIIKLILQILFRSFKEAWAPLTPVEFEHVSSEINPQFAQIADENDLVVLSRFESESSTASAGFIDMVVPYMSLKPIRDLLRSRLQTGDGNEESDKIWRDQLAYAVQDASVEAQVALGKVEITMAQLKNLQVGDTLPFRKPDHARMSVGDKPVFDVEVGSLGNNAAVLMVKPVSPAPANPER